ncbi:MAG: RluA family pseudouridine synthase [Acidimicrobiia bacterium]|nr:RluA family pseudouridine synthase [Acidimicrobiia bacterium]
MILEIPSDLEGERLDKAIAEMLGVSRAAAKQLIEIGVTVDGEPSKANRRMSVGEQVVTPPPPQAVALEPEDLDLTVLFEDDDVVVINKMPGMVVHPGAGQTRGTLAAGLLHAYPGLEGVGSQGRWGLVHRLDKGTSGALLVARTEESFQRLTQALRAREIKREYVALVEGVLRPPTGTIDAPIGRDPVQPTRRAVTPDGKHARTHYQVRSNNESANVALVDVQLETGRTHQIRVHFAAIGHPVVGDRVYGSGSTTVSSPRMFLHAGKLTFSHPGTGEEIAVSAPLPDDLQAVVDDLPEVVEE